ncbi:MAG: class I SAM-dependent methyltransferase [Deltaproteobacteria bacterium]|nr:class I SAM-dependent methyltransferase [Deltaproteobacteria bacterium]
MATSKSSGSKSPASRAARIKTVRSMASRADRHLLYERSVQDPEGDTRVLARLFRRLKNRVPQHLREDFCGTATLSAHWVRDHDDRTATGVDLDAETLAWGRAHHLRGVESQVDLLERNVLDGGGRKADISCALNFSYCVFKTRDALRRYFEVARSTLADDGIFVIDCFGGWGAFRPERERRKVEDFYYEWERAHFDPLTNEVLCHIHFSFLDGSRIDRAFTYDWRWWSVQELRELLFEAGFKAVHALWERTDDDGEGTGAYYEPRRVENQELWWTYVVAER